ncbi:hypothetical protein [Xenorhabdus entomophaga]|uniref:hypothetical protein n=1 Tax=Xenorhabdus entomophaga TaxID=3136257 RepID=UPI0030F3C8B2
MHKSDTVVTNINTSDNNWDNVDHIKSVVIGAGDASSYNSAGTLFINAAYDDNNLVEAHSLPIYVGISFTLINDKPGPTDDEVRAALTWVNSGTGASVSGYLDNFPSSVTDTYHQYYYDESSSQLQRSSSNENYDHNLTYSLYAGKNALSGETVDLALNLTATLSDGTQFIWWSGTGQTPQASLPINFVAAKTYRTTGSESTPIVSQVKNSNPPYTITDSNFNHDHDKVQLWSVFIDDPNGIFVIHDYLEDYNEQYGDTYMTYPNYESKEKDTVMWDTVYTSGGTWYQIGQKTYDHAYNVYSGTDGKGGNLIFSIKVTIEQSDNEIVFIYAQTNIEHLKDEASGNNYPLIHLHDQFGNRAAVSISGTTDSSQYIKVSGVTAW